MSDQMTAVTSRWIRFGRHIIPFDGAEGRSATALKVVVQEGRLFQRAHPDCRVVSDLGRFLLVEAPEPIESVEGAYAVLDAEPGAVVFDEPAITALAPVDWVAELAQQVSESELAATVDTLTGFPTRESTSPHFAEALDAMRRRLDGLGYATSTQPIPGSSQNLIADRPGSGSRRDLVIVTAHLDSVNHDGGAAPGADDNASGCAGVLEIARVLRTLRATHDLRLILFGGEEQGLLGSRAYVDALPQADRARIKAVVNMDMIATQNTPQPGVLLEGAASSLPVLDALAQAAATYTSLTVQTSLHPFASDHVPFIEAGLPAVLTIEAADGANGDVHTAADTADKLELPLAREIVRMNVAMLAAQLGREPLPDIGKPVRAGFSGRYAHNGGADVREAEPEPAAPDEPTFRPPRPTRDLRFTLHVDIDGPDPLGVVSGTVARGSETPHFIGRVTSNRGNASKRSVTVEDFAFTWPGSNVVVDTLKLTVTDGRALASFYTAAGKRHAGPLEAERVSTFFRDIRVEVDVEDGAVNPEPYNTHTHPDRPADLPGEDLTLEKAFARAGIRITRSAPNTISTAEAGANMRWNYAELHDAMEVHWSEFANRPQWKLWIFLAELADSDTLGGVMFDGDIDEPGGVDRQGTAIFTLAPHFHTAGGAYPQANPPADAAARRELFFDLIHETGHAFNLAHSFQKQAVFDPGDVAWPAPPWLPLVDDPQALSWMNYPDEASPGSGFSAKWFYDRFRFRFDDGENLFLRHAPGRFVQMGNEAWFHNHGRVERGSLDPRLELKVRTRTPRVQLGEPVFLELRLRNRSAETVLCHRRLNPADGLVELAVTGPDGERRPFLPFIHPRRTLEVEPLAPGEKTYQALNATMGSFGFPFKTPGLYRIEAAYRNLDGSTAAAALQIEVEPAVDPEARRAARLLFDARVGRALNVGGTRVMEDVNERIDEARELLGPEHPASYYLTAARALPYAKPFKTMSADAVRLEDADPEYVEHELGPVVADAEPAADAIGHILFGRIVDTYADAAAEAGKPRAGKEALERTSRMFAERDVIAPVVEALSEKAARLA